MALGQVMKATTSIAVAQAGQESASMSTTRLSSCAQPGRCGLGLAGSERLAPPSGGSADASTDGAGWGSGRSGRALEALVAFSVGLHGQNISVQPKLPPSSQTQVLHPSSMENLAPGWYATPSTTHPVKQSSVLLQGAFDLCRVSGVCINDGAAVATPRQHHQRTDPRCNYHSTRWPFEPPSPSNSDQLLRKRKATSVPNDAAPSDGPAKARTHACGRPV